MRRWLVAVLLLDGDDFVQVGEEGACRPLVCHCSACYNGNPRKHAVDETLLRELYLSLDQRRRPEEIAAVVRRALAGGVDRETEQALRAVARHARPAGWSSMAAEFARPVGMGRQLAKASELFRTPVQRARLIAP